MKINVRVTPNAKVPTIEKVDANTYNVRVNARAVEGRANTRMIEMLAEHFGIRKTKVCILKGFNSKNKVVEVTTS
jgi:hypothetical protein